METNQTFEQPSTRPGLELNLQAQDFLRQAGKWASFLGIIGFILTAFTFLSALFVSSIFATAATLARARDPQSDIASILTGVMTITVTCTSLVQSIIYFLFSLYLYQFGNRIKKGVFSADSNEISRALGKLKSFFRLWGILTVIGLCLFAIIIIICIALGVGTAIVRS